jgi:hypothetical protein
MEPATPGPRRASDERRVLAALLAILLAIGAAVVLIAMVHVGHWPRCGDTVAVRRAASAHHARVKCLDLSATRRSVTLGLGWAGGVTGVLAALIAIGFAVTGRRGRLLLAITALALILSGACFLVGAL